MKLKDFFEQKAGQTAMEVLLMVAGAILVVLLIGLYLKKKTTEVGKETTQDINALVKKI